MVTMNKVAAKAGVSQATVSLVLAGRADSRKISSETQERVMNAAREMGYRRNQLARAMVTGKSRIIGVLTAANAGENIIRVLAGATEAASEDDYLLKIIHVSEGAIDEATITRCLEWRLAGAMAVGLSEKSLHTLQDSLHRAQIALALIDSAPLPEWGVRILSDDDLGIRQAVSHLMGLGHRRIAFLGGRPGEVSERRERSFRAALAETGLNLPAHWTRNTSWSNREEIEKGVRAMFEESKGNLPTAIVCSADSIAMTVERVARSLGLRIPADLSVTGYSNQALSAFADPPLTTINQQFHAMGSAAVTHLIHCAENENPNLSIGPRPEILLPTQLVERNSTAPPRSE